MLLQIFNFIRVEKKKERKKGMNSESERIDSINESTKELHYLKVGSDELFWNLRRTTKKIGNGD